MLGTLRRRIARLAFAVGAGAMMSCLVAVLAAMCWVPTAATGSRGSGRVHRSGDVEVISLSTERTLWVRYDTYLVFCARFDDPAAIDRGLDAAAQWLDVSEVDCTEEVAVIQCGWPLPAFRGVALPSRMLGTEYEHAVRLRPAPASGRHTQFRMIPLQPLWLGLLVDSSFFAALAVGISAIPWCRRRARIRRGLCPSCAYPVGDSSPCTECGWTMATAPQRPTSTAITPQNPHRRTANE